MKTDIFCNTQEMIMHSTTITFDLRGLNGWREADLKSKVRGWANRKAIDVAWSINDHILRIRFETEYPPAGCLKIAKAERSIARIIDREKLALKLQGRMIHCGETEL